MIVEEKLLETDTNISNNARIINLYQNSRSLIADLVAYHHTDPLEADDLIQDVFELLIKNPDKLENIPIAYQKSFVIGIARNLLSRNARLSCKNRFCEKEFFYAEAIQDHRLQIIKLKKLDLFYKCLNRLSHEERNIILEIKKGKSNKMVAQRYSYTLETFKKKKKACIFKLARLINQDPDLCFTFDSYLHNADLLHIAIN